MINLFKYYFFVFKFLSQEPFQKSRRLFWLYRSLILIETMRKPLSVLCILKNIRFFAYINIFHFLVSSLVYSVYWPLSVQSTIFGILSFINEVSSYRIRIPLESVRVLFFELSASNVESNGVRHYTLYPSHRLGSFSFVLRLFKPYSLSFN